MTVCFSLSCKKRSWFRFCKFNSIRCLRMSKFNNNCHYLSYKKESWFRFSIFNYLRCSRVSKFIKQMPFVVIHNEYLVVSNEFKIAISHPNRDFKKPITYISSSHLKLSRCCEHIDNSYTTAEKLLAGGLILGDRCERQNQLLLFNKNIE